jgi:hypothetical protein
MIRRVAQEPELVVRPGDPFLVARSKRQHGHEGGDRDHHAGNGEESAKLDPPEAPDREIDQIVERYGFPPVPSSKNR